MSEDEITKFAEYMQGLIERLEKKKVKFAIYRDGEGYMHIQFSWRDGTVSDYPQDGVCEVCGEKKVKPLGVQHYNKPHPFNAVGNLNGEFVFKTVHIQDICSRCLQEAYKASQKLKKK